MENDESMFKHIVDDATIGIGIFSSDKVIYANSILLTMFEYDVEAPVSYTEFFCRRATSKTKAILQERENILKDGGTVGPFIGEFIRENGDTMFVEIDSKSFKRGAELFRLCFMEEVTEKVQTKIALDLEMRRYENIISGTDAGTWELNLKTGALATNERWTTMFGYTKQELPNPSSETWNSLVHPQDAKRIAEQWRPVDQRQTEVLKFEARVRHKQGRWVWIMSNGRVTRWADDGSPLILSGSNLDITEKKLAESALVQAKAELELSLSDLKIASQERQDFLSIVSHEIRTPLNAVIGLANLLLRRSPRPDQVEIIKTLKHSSDSLFHLVNDILDYNKIQSRKLQLESVRFNFREFLQQLHGTFKLDAKDRGIDLQVKSDSAIPDTLEGDITRINQILMNLVSNAIKFTKKGKVTLDASLADRKDGYSKIRFTISDTGIGIDPSQIDQIFEPFRQSDASITRQFGGTGLGLSIVKALVKIFEGTIDVESALGKGSTFTVMLKLKEAPKVQGSFLPVTREPRFKDRLKILYVEDVESNRFLVKNLLLDFNIACTVASTGVEAVGWTSRDKFDVILMDIQMPGMDGYETTKIIRNQPFGKNKETPVLAFTAEPITGALLERLAQHNMKDVVPKPFDIEQLVQKLRKAAVPNAVEMRDGFSFEFYKRAAAASGTGMQNIRTLVANDLTHSSRELRAGYDAANLPKIRAEIHRIRPIVNHLKIADLLDPLDLLRQMTVVGAEMDKEITIVCRRLDHVADVIRRTEN